MYILLIRMNLADLQMAKQSIRPRSSVLLQANSEVPALLDTKLLTFNLFFWELINYSCINVIVACKYFWVKLVVLNFYLQI